MSAYYESQIFLYFLQVRGLLSLSSSEPGQMSCLLDRVRGLGDGAAAGARRRQWAAKKEEERLGTTGPRPQRGFHGFITFMEIIKQFHLYHFTPGFTTMETLWAL